MTNKDFKQPIPQNVIISNEQEVYLRDNYADFSYASAKPQEGQLQRLTSD